MTSEEGFWPLVLENSSRAQKFEFLSTLEKTPFLKMDFEMCFDSEGLEVEGSRWWTRGGN